MKKIGEGYAFSGIFCYFVSLHHDSGFQNLHKSMTKIQQINISSSFVSFRIFCTLHVGIFFCPPPDDMSKYVTNIHYRVASAVCVLDKNCAYIYIYIYIYISIDAPTHVLCIFGTLRSARHLFIVI